MLYKIDYNTADTESMTEELWAEAGCEVFMMLMLLDVPAKSDHSVTSYTTSCTAQPA